MLTLSYLFERTRFAKEIKKAVKTNNSEFLKKTLSNMNPSNMVVYPHGSDTIR